MSNGTDEDPEGTERGGEPAAVERTSDDLPDGPEEVDAELLDVRSGSQHTERFFLKAELGPLPSQEWLEAAERHSPGVTKILVDDLVAQREHARAMEKGALDFDEQSFGAFASYQTKQLWMAFLLAILVAGGGLVLALDGKSVEAFAVLIAELAALVGVFLYGRRHESDSAPSDDER